MQPFSARGSLLALVVAGASLLSCSEKRSGGDAAQNAGAGQGVTGGTGSGGTSAAGGSSGEGAGTGGMGGSATGGSATGGSSGSGASGGTAGSGASGGSAGMGGTAGGAGGSATGGSAGGAATGGSATGGSATGGSSGGGGAPTGDPAVHFVGRVDDSDPANVRFAWSGTGAVARFDGTSVGAALGGGQEYTVVIDGAVQPKLVATSGMNALATGLDAGTHTVELYRRTEASQGESVFMGFDFGGGTLLAPSVPTRRLEFIGDSITCGYGDEGPDMNCSFSAATENHYLTYAAITARNLGAELSTVAWSGKGAVCNYGDDASSCNDPLPIYYDRVLPSRSDSVWDFSRFVPDAVVINLGTNDFSTDVDPSASMFEAGYTALLQHLREKYPDAYILLTNGPMLTDPDLAKLKGYMLEVVTTLADPKISTFDIPTQDGSDGFGCDWHPSLARHEKMATVVTAELKGKLGW